MDTRDSKVGYQAGLTPARLQDKQRRPFTPSFQPTQEWGGGARGAELAEKSRQAAYRALFRSELDSEAIAKIRLALSQNQPLGNNRFHAQIARKPGGHREARPRGRPRMAEGIAVSATQESLQL